MDDETLLAVVAAIPEGCWMSYADVCAAAGGSARQALGLNGRLTRLEAPGAWRVLKANGTIAPTALGAPERVREQLLEEGVTFEKGRARSEQRLRPAEGVAAEAAAREASAARREAERLRRGEEDALVVTVGAVELDTPGDEPPPSSTAQEAADAPTA